MIVRTILLFASVVASTNASDNGATVCWGDDPTHVLRCLEDAAAASDLEQFGRLFAADYVFEEYHGGVKTHVFTRDQQLSRYERIFGQGIVSVVTFGPASVGELEPGYLWRLETSWSGVITFPDDRDDVTVSTNNTVFTVRRVDEPTPHYEIVTWAAIWP